MSTTELAERTGITASAIRAHENDQNGIRPEVAEKYANALGVAPEAILFGAPQRRASARAPRLVPVLGAVQAGTWSEIPDNPPEPTNWVSVVDPRWARAQNIYALEVKGTSMNRIYTREGFYVVVADVHEAGVREEDHVVVRRMRSGLAETTLKEAIIGEGGRIELWPRSTDPAHQEPLIYDRGSDDVEIIGVVISAIWRAKRDGAVIF
jgi:SOS-response transcriptional repressor LexA